MILVSENDILLTKASPPPSDGQTVSTGDSTCVTYSSSNIQINPPPVYVASLPPSATATRPPATPKPTNYLCIKTDKLIKGHYVIVSNNFVVSVVVCNILF
jgi:hypothetical protein